MILYHRVGKFFNLIFFSGEFGFEFFKVGCPVNGFEMELFFKVFRKCCFSRELWAGNNTVFGLRSYIEV
jgi:hypothetical protein